MSQANITALLVAHERGEPEAMAQVFELIYGELKHLASGQRRRAHAGETLNTTALVNELYLKLADSDGEAGRHREHFLAIAARAMRQLLVDHARSLNRDKRGGGLERVSLSAAEIALHNEAEHILDLHRALEKLEALEPRLVRVTECRHLLGLSETETASALDLSLRTVQRDWQAASRWLARELSPEGEAATPP
ncbi:MAG: RNA polymerase subunit sigma-70 [Xanthomonadales bacterium]|nr:RNA polymerase subunit sigma-70 [Xanthomonadales bacterium]